MRKSTKKLGVIGLLIAILLGQSMVNTSSQEQIKQPLLFEDFEGVTNVRATSGASVSIINEDHGRVVKMETFNSGEPNIAERSIVVTKDQAVDVSAYKYVTFWVKDANTNSARISLIDAHGNSVDGVWTADVTAGRWTQLSVALSHFSNLDLTRIVGMYIGQWNSGTYLIDRIEFSDTANTDILVQTFESETGYQVTSGATGAIVSTQRNSGIYSLKYAKIRSDSPERNQGSMRINFQHPVNVEQLQYLVFYIKDTQGSNTMRVSLIDGNGQESDFAWRSMRTAKDQWIPFHVHLDEFNNIDKSNIVGMRLGQWNAGTYYIDDVYFAHNLYTGVPESTSLSRLVAPIITPSNGTYGKRQLVSISSATQNSTIHYTTDGSTPTTNSPIFTSDFYVSADTTIKAITVKNNQTSAISENRITITSTNSAFLRTDGKVMRNHYGAGDIVQLKGTNIGGWLVMEEWQSPTNAPDQLTMLRTLTNRFGEARAWELINTFQDHWFVEEDFRILKEEGVNVLRLPITYFEMAYNDGSLKQTAFDRMDWFIEEAAKHGIYTLIDMHGAFGSQNGKDHSGDITIPDKGDFFGNEDNIQKTVALWEAIARRYNGNPWVAGYDLLNEPGGASGKEQFDVYDRIYQAIRAIDQDHIIHIQAIWDPVDLPDPEVYGWENVVYQYHFYGWDDINNASYQRWFVDSKVQQVNEQTNYNVPLFVGEFTFFENIDSWDYGLRIFHEEGWSYTSWAYKVAGANSSWGMYTMPRDGNTIVNIYNDDFDTIKRKWSNLHFTRNDRISDILSKYFRS